MLLGSDVALKALAAADLQGAATSEEQVKLGDAWWKVAKQRAIYWYARAESGADSQLLKDRLEKRIKEGTQTTRWIRIFRSADPSHWNLDADRAGTAKVPENIKYLKMQIARKMVVIIEMTKDRLGQDRRASARLEQEVRMGGGKPVKRRCPALGDLRYVSRIEAGGRPG